MVNNAFRPFEIQVDFSLKIIGLSHHIAIIRVSPYPLNIEILSAFSSNVP